MLITHSLLHLLQNGELTAPASHMAVVRDSAKQLQWVPRYTESKLTSQKLYHWSHSASETHWMSPFFLPHCCNLKKRHLNTAPVQLHLNHEPVSFFVGTLSISFSHPGTSVPTRMSFLDWWPLKGSKCADVQDYGWTIFWEAVASCRSVQEYFSFWRLNWVLLMAWISDG